MTLRSCLYVGQVFHKRFRPKRHALSYSVFSLLIDLAELQELDKRFWLFSYNRFNLLSFYDRDVGEGADESLTEYVHRQLRLAGQVQTTSRIMLSCYPRVLGHAFNPLSLFYCLDESDHCFAVVHEVHNTFGERHCYVLPVGSEVPAHSSWMLQQTDKALFVSPFAHMDMRYKFQLNYPAKQQVIRIRVFDEQGVVVTASYEAQHKVLSTSQLLTVFLRYPLLGAKVVVGIHWEALKLWVKGVPFFKHQPKRSI